MFTLEFLRHFRIAGYAIFDLTISFLGIYLLSPLLSKLFMCLRLKIPRISWLFFTLPMGIGVHLLIGTMTPMTKNFIDMNSNYVLKIIIIVLFILGLRNIKVSKKHLHK